tara:strand:+ start:11697 stop:12281 length:585 start_codon:yes stop_codon:yes gene_type:complete
MSSTVTNPLHAAADVVDVISSENTKLDVKTPSNLYKKLESIKTQFGENYPQFINGIPTAFILIPLILFLLSPSESSGIFLFGAIFTSIVALIFTNPKGKSFCENYVSFHGLAIGYLVGYLLMDNIQKAKLGSMLSTCVMGLFIIVITTASLYKSSDIYKKLLHVGVGWLLGIFIGMFFSFSRHQLKRYEEKSAN